MSRKKEEQGILLESGTNEFEIVEFTVGGVHYGINAAKVREVISLVSVTLMPQAHSYVDGLFTLRGKAIPLVDLARSLHTNNVAKPRNIIVTEINNYNIGFKVENVYRIHRISWKDMEASPAVGGSNRTTGVVKMKDRLILLIDFESIIAEINPVINEKFSTIEETTRDIQDRRGDIPIVSAEDSVMLRELLLDTLRKSGYANVRGFNNGQEAYEYLLAAAEKNGDIRDYVGAIISDIEMPKMDGHRLLKLIRSDERFDNVPFVLFSSLISEDMRRKGDRLGANGQIAKPEIAQVIELLDKLTLGEE